MSKMKKPYRVPVLIDIELHAKLEAFARLHGVPLSKVVRAALQERLPEQIEAKKWQAVLQRLKELAEWRD